MVESACFKGSTGTGRLGCVSCHDPHERVRPAARDAHYRGRCLQCHERKGWRAPGAGPVREERGGFLHRLPHAAFRERRCSAHRLDRPPHPTPARRRARRNPRSRSPRPRAGRVPPRRASLERGGGSGPGRGAGGAGPARGRSTARIFGALPALEAALCRDPGDFAAGEAKGYALGCRSGGRRRSRRSRPCWPVAATRVGADGGGGRDRGARPGRCGGGLPGGGRPRSTRHPPTTAAT